MGLGPRNKSEGTMSEANNTDSNINVVGMKPRRLVKVKEALTYGRFGRTKFYELVRAGEIKAYKSGGTTLVDLDSIDQFHALLPPLELNLEFELAG